MGDRSDAELVAAARAGDRTAFETLYRRHRDWVVSLAYRFCRHEHDALDVLQETFAYVWRRLPNLELRARFTTFLYPAVKHIALDRLRAARRHVPLPDEDTFAATGGLSGDIRDMLSGLPAAQQEVVVLRFADGFALQEIADALAIPLGTVKSRLHSALRALENQLEDPREEPPE